MFFSPQYAQFVFPRVDLEVDADGTKIQYSFTFQIYAYSAPDLQYANASLNAAAYRDGEITVDGNKARVVVVDFNSNGRFDDLTVVNEQVLTADGTVYPQMGDMIFVDPGRGRSPYASGYDPTTSDSQQYLGKIVNIGGRFYDLQITPAGDKLTLTASAAAVGKVHNANQGYRAVVYGDQGFIKIQGDESGNAPLPAGDWKLLSYTIDRTESSRGSEGGCGSGPEPEPAAEPCRPAHQSGRRRGTPHHDGVGRSQAGLSGGDGQGRGNRRIPVWPSLQAVGGRHGPTRAPIRSFWRCR